MNPDELSMETAEVVAWGMLDWAFLNLYPMKQLDFISSEGLVIEDDIYTPSRLFKVLNPNYLDFDKKNDIVSI